MSDEDYGKYRDEIVKMCEGKDNDNKGAGSKYIGKINSRDIYIDSKISDPTVNMLLVFGYS